MDDIEALKEATKLQIKQDENAINNIRNELLKQKVHIFERNIKWLQGVSTVSIAVGAAIIPLLFSSESVVTGYNQTFVAIAGLILIFNGSIIIFFEKQGIEHDDLFVNIMGQKEIAILSERVDAANKFLNDEISGDKYTALSVKGMAESMKPMDLKEIKRKDVSYTGDIHVAALYTGLILLFTVLIPKEYLVLYLSGSACVLIAFIFIAYRSGVEVKRISKLKKGYEERLKTIESARQQTYINALEEAVGKISIN